MIIDTFFDKSNPQLAAYDALQKIYSKNDNVLFVITAKSGSVFDPKVLQAMHDLTERSWKLPFARRVDSVTNFQYSHAEGDELIVEDLFDPENNYSADDLKFLKEGCVGRTKPQWSTYI